MLSLKLFSFILNLYFMMGPRVLCGFFWVHTDILIHFSGGSELHRKTNAYKAWVSQPKSMEKTMFLVHLYDL